MFSKQFSDSDSALIGASKVSQIEENLAALKNPTLSAAELEQIDKILAG